MAEADDDKIHNQSPDKSLTPPVADIQPADSQSSIHATPDIKSPERIGATINQVRYIFSKNLNRLFVDKFINIFFYSLLQNLSHKQRHFQPEQHH